MAAAAQWLWREMGVAAELSGATAVAAILSGRYCPAAGERVCAVVCGAGTNGINRTYSRSRSIATSGASAGGIG